MGTERDPRVDDYLAGLQPWQAEVAARLRDLIHQMDAEIEETLKRRVQPHFVLQGNACACLGTKDHLNLFLYDGALVPDPHGIINQGHDNQTARCAAFYEGDPIPRDPLLEMLRTIVANNRAGGRRKLKGRWSRR